jgi:hypothetical protein
MTARRKREITGLSNERDFPHLVELALPPKGLRAIFLDIDTFHRHNRIPARRGRSQHDICDCWRERAYQPLWCGRTSP